VSRAARLEPITPPGQVYASEAFAALAAAQRTPDFTCDYVGQTPMAKAYGTLPAYHVRPRSSDPKSLHRC
jgi:class 3 adenylate cyclase